MDMNNDYIILVKMSDGSKPFVTTEFNNSPIRFQFMCRSMMYMYKHEVGYIIHQSFFFENEYNYMHLNYQ